MAPVPDLDRTDHFLCIGSNPVVSNGSAMVTPDVKGRLKAIRARGGKVVTVDPRFTETSRLADEHVFIRPGGDAALLLAMTRVLIEPRAARTRARSRSPPGFEEVARRIEPFTPERVAETTGIDAATTRRLALEFAEAPTSVAYTRIGTCNAVWGSLATWAGDLLNLVAGRLGAVGGAMFAEPPLDIAQVAARIGMNGHARWRSRVRGLPEMGSDLPAAVLAEEMETPGPGAGARPGDDRGQPGALHPQRRSPGARAGGARVRRGDRPLRERDHAPCRRDPAALLVAGGGPQRAAGAGLRASHPRALVAAGGGAGRGRARRLGDPAGLTGRLGGGPTGLRAVDAALRVVERLGWHFEPSKLLDLLLRLGPHGDRFLPWSDGINLAKLKAAPHGLDLGPARPGVAHRIHHRDRRVHLVAAPIVESLEKLAGELGPPCDPEELLLIGRRDLRSCNSWMHNAPSLVSGRERCVLLVHPADAARAGVRDGGRARLESRVHAGEVPVRVTEEVMPGVVSLPHGWGHAASAEWQSVAGAHAGVSATTGPTISASRASWASRC